MSPLWNLTNRHLKGGVLGDDRIHSGISVDFAIGAGSFAIVPPSPVDCLPLNVANVGGIVRVDQGSCDADCVGRDGHQCSFRLCISYHEKGGSPPDHAGDPLTLPERHHPLIGDEPLLPYGVLITLNHALRCHTLKKQGDGGACLLRHPQCLIDFSGTETVTSLVSVHREGGKHCPLIGSAEL